MPYLLSRSGLDANLPVGIFLNYIQKYISLNYASNTCVMGPVLSPTGQHGRMCWLHCLWNQIGRAQAVKEKKEQQHIIIYIEDNFFDECKRWLQSTPEEKKHLNIDKQTKQKLARNKWTLTCQGKVTASDNKKVVPKRDIYRLLCEAHTATAHRGRDKTESIRNYYTGISQDVVNLFVSLCKLHQEQKSVTNHCKKPILTPIKANQFLGHVEMDLIDFRNLPCECHLRHLWVLHVVDHYTKFSWLFALKRKQTEEVAGALTNLFWMFGFPSVLHSDNGKEFKSKTMSELCV